MMGFDDVLLNDHFGMINNKEFGVKCTNTSNNQVFNIIKTDSFVLVSDEGLPIVEDKPMFNTSEKFKDDLGVIQTNSISQYDKLMIDGSFYTVREVRRDGIGGLDIYLKG